MTKRANPRKIKRHRNYTIDEAARVLDVTKGTVRHWIKNGLPALTDKRPFLILGGDLTDYLEARRSDRQRCLPHQFYCFGCRTPRDPAFGEVEYHGVNATGGNLRALCATCATVMHKRISSTALHALNQQVTVQIRQD